MNHFLFTLNNNLGTTKCIENVEVSQVRVTIIALSGTMLSVNATYLLNFGILFQTQTFQNAEGDASITMK